MGAHVLVVDDDPDTRDLVGRYLEREGHHAVVVGTGAGALLRLDQEPVDLTILDLGLPDVPGEDVLAEHRRRGIPVVILTARTGTPETIRGLELGADDYVTKPFSPRELMLRVRSVLRRCSPASEPRVLTFDGGRLVIDEYRHEVSLDNETLHLTPGEWCLLRALATYPGRAFSRLDLLGRIHPGEEYDGYERTVDGHVKNLRHKLGEPADAVRIVETVPGVGYRLGVPRDQ